MGTRDEALECSGGGPTPGTLLEKNSIQILGGTQWDGADFIPSLTTGHSLKCTNCLLPTFFNIFRP